MFVANSAVNAQMTEPCAWTPCGGEADCEKNGVVRTVGPFYCKQFPRCPWFLTIKEITCRNDEGLLEKSVCEILPSFESQKSECQDLRNALDTKPYYNIELAGKLMAEVYDQFLLSDVTREYKNTPADFKKYIECPYGAVRYTLVAASCSYAAPFYGTVKLGPVEQYGDIGNGQGGELYEENMLVSVEGVRWVPCNGIHCCRKHTRICWDKDKGVAVVKDVAYVSNNPEGTCTTEYMDISNVPPPPLPAGLKYRLKGYLQQCQPNCDNILGK
jgi:hypothetical protein